MIMNYENLYREALVKNRNYKLEVTRLQSDVNYFARIAEWWETLVERLEDPEHGSLFVDADSTLEEMDEISELKVALSAEVIDSMERMGMI